jgi:L-talarate/galactarate dehydratase
MTMKITRIEAELHRVPLKRAVSLPTSQDPISSNVLDVVLVRVHTTNNHVGLGFCHSFGGGELLVALLNSTIIPAVVGLDARRTEWVFERVSSQLAGVGFAGPVARAYATIDLALWDWKGKTAGAPVWQSLGGYRSAVKPISADVATPALGVKQSLRECKAALDRGSAGIQIEVGTMDPDLDYERLKQLRDEIPDGAWFEINCSARYDFATAIWLATVGTEELGLDGFADPLKPSDPNLRRLSDRIDVGLSIGAHADNSTELHRVLLGGGVESLRLDPFRLGGLTPTRKLALAAELHHVSLYPVRCPEVGVHLGCASLLGRMCEHVDWLDDFFGTTERLKNGQLFAPDEPGLGLTVNDTLAKTTLA